jgi:eukaryotic-like serine/threonine-protein kinase
MEMCTGNLSGLLSEAKSALGKPGLPAIDATMLGLMVADALKAIHETSGKFHGDVKPENILLAPEAASPGAKAPSPMGVRLIDFAFTSHLPGRLVRVANGYVAPECIQGNSHSSASDVYSLGATLLFALTHQKPYGGVPPDDLTKLLFIESTLLDISLHAGSLDYAV